MMGVTHNKIEWIPQVIHGLAELPPQITLPLGAFLLAAFAIWAMHSVARGRQ